MVRDLGDEVLKDVRSFAKKRFRRPFVAYCDRSIERFGSISNDLRGRRNEYEYEPSNLEVEVLGRCTAARSGMRG